MLRISPSPEEIPKSFPGLSKTGYKAVMLIPSNESLVEYYKRFGFGEPSYKLDFSNGYDLGTGDAERDVAVVLTL